MQVFLILLFLAITVGSFTAFLGIGWALLFFLYCLVVYALWVLMSDAPLHPGEKPLVRIWGWLTWSWDQIIFMGGCLMNPWMAEYFKPTKGNKE